ncbi:MAG: SGNH/GDSL hydrolase family protein [Kiritimatiellae bacterium]|nr:SGNH/GDSL hydrolase family protein [Kiritimatiellia bacterium]
MKTSMRREFAPLLILMMASAGAPAGERAVEAELHEHVTNAFINPGKASSLPRVLIIGDSISIGYTDPVRHNLKGIADVSRPPVNCQHTGYGLANITTWLGTGKWDVIHFNFGIWDTHLLDEKGNLMSASIDGDKKRPKGVIRIRHTPEQYGANLTKILEILKGTGAKLIWASSTPIMYRTGERFEAIPTLNRVAADLMTSHGVAIDDLYAFVLPHVKEWQNPDKCHFNAQGNAQLGKQVAECIQRAIAMKDQ